MCYAVRLCGFAIKPAGAVAVLADPFEDLESSVEFAVPVGVRCAVLGDFCGLRWIYDF